MRNSLARLVQNWVYGGFLAGLLLLALMPELSRSWSVALSSVFLLLPVYMFHQWEEHDDDRFRRFINQAVGGGREVLSPLAVFVINVPGVWGLIAVSFCLAANRGVGYGLIAVYLTLVNAVVHILHGVRTRTYNPGLVTAVVLFLPASAYSLWALHRTGEVGWGHHLLGLVTAIGIHVAIVAYVKVMSRRAERSQETGSNEEAVLWQSR